jgi:hypothetical protein
MEEEVDGYGGLKWWDRVFSGNIECILVAGIVRLPLLGSYLVEGVKDVKD